MEKIKIQGKKIFLRSLEISDVYNNWWKWFNDKDVTKYLNKGLVANTPEKQLEFFNKINNSPSDLVLAICDNESGNHIGTTGIHNFRIENEKKTGNYGIIIGEKEYWGKGIGSEAWYLILNYAYETLDLEIIITKIFTHNTASLRIAEKLGFETVEIKKNDFSKNGISIDRAILKLDFNNWKSK